MTFLVVPALFGLLIAILVIQIRIYRGMRKLPEMCIRDSSRFFPETECGRRLRNRAP